MSMYTTAQLLAANEKKFKFDPLFLRLFFRESYPFTTEKVYLSQIPGLVNMALYVSPIVSGEVIRSRGGSTSEFTPGYVKPKHEVNPQMTLRRLPDEDPQNLADPAYRRRRIIMQNMRDEELAIAQVEEMQAVSAVLKGKYTMTGEAFDPVEVDMGRSAANNITQSGGTEWSKRDKSTYDPTDDIEAYALNASGVVNIIVFDPKGWALFRSFKAVKEKLDTRRGSNSELETAVKDLGEAVSYKGMYGDTAIVVYSGQYVENDVKKNFLPDNTMVLGNTQARGLRTYGCIQDADAQREGINASDRVASSAISQSASQVARETKVRRKLVKERARLKRATVKNPQARIRVNRGDLPVIKLGNARVVLSRRRRRKKGQRSSLKGGGSVLVVGNRRIPGAFIQQLKNGRWHVMQRVAGKNRYPIDVVKIPMAEPLTTAFKQNIERIRRERLPKELGYALQHQLRMVIKR